jgi:hypothetical protein
MSLFHALIGMPVFIALNVSCILPGGQSALTGEMLVSFTPGQLSVRSLSPFGRLAPEATRPH